MKNSGSAKSEEVLVIIETPAGSRNKFKYDAFHRGFKLSKVLPEGMVFPYDFGYVPSTQAEDGDPLDVLVLTDEPLSVGCIVDCRLVGVLEAEQEENGKRNRNDRVIAVATQSLLYSEVHDIDDLNGTVLKQIEDFFVNYQRVRNVKVTILGRGGKKRAIGAVQKATHRKAA